MSFQAKLAWLKSTFRVTTLPINVEAYSFLSLYNLYWYEFIYLFYWFHTFLILSIIWWCSILLRQKHSISSPWLAQTGASISLSNAERDKKMRQLNLGHLLSLIWKVRMKKINNENHIIHKPTVANLSESIS